MNKYQALCNLRSLLRTMERDLGLDDLSSTELDIFLAAQSLGGKCDDVITTTELRAHELVASLRTKKVTGRDRKAARTGKTFAARLVPTPRPHHANTS